MAVICPHCQAKLKLPLGLNKGRGRCPACRRAVMISPPVAETYPKLDVLHQAILPATISCDDASLSQVQKKISALSDHSARRMLMYENCVKNILVIGLLWWIFPQIEIAIDTLPVDLTGNFLALVGLLLAGSIAGRFAFSYNQTNLGAWIDRFFGHMTTFCLTFGIGLMLEMSVLALVRQPQQLYAYPVYWATLMVFTAIILCDCWDALRLAHADGAGSP